MSEVASMYLQGRLPGWFNRLFASARLVAPVKKLGEGRAPDVRPVAVGEAERRAAERAVVDNMKEAYVSVLAPSQLGVGIPAGDSVLIHGFRLVAEKLGPRAVIVHTDLRNAYNEAWRRTDHHPTPHRLLSTTPCHPCAPSSLSTYLVVDDRSAPLRSEDGVQQGASLATTSFCVAIHPEVQQCDITLEVTDGAARCNADDGFLVGLPEHVWPALHAFRTSIKASVGLEVRFDKMQAYIADMEAARREAPADIEWPELDGHHGIAVLNVPLRSPEYVQAYMRGKAEELREEVDASLSKLLSAKPSRRYTHALHHHAWALLKLCMQHKAGYWLRNCLPSEVEAFAEAVDATILAAVERVLGVSFDPSTYSTDTNPVVTDFLAELLHDPDPWQRSYAAEMREAWGRLQAATAGHLGDADARQMEREVEAASGSQKELTAFLDQANNSRLRNEVCALPATCRERILFNQLDAASGMWTVAIPTARTAMTPHELREDLVPDAELSLPAFNVVTGSYDPRSLKSTLLEFKTMRYGVKYTAVPRATAVDRFERSLLGDIQRGLAVRDAAWHNTEPGQKGPLRDIMDMSEYTGMVFGAVGVDVGVVGGAGVAAKVSVRDGRVRLNEGGQRTLDLLSSSLTAQTLMSYADILSRFAEFCHDSENISALEATTASVVKYVSWFGELGHIWAKSLQPYLSAINTFFELHNLDPIAKDSPHLTVARRGLMLRQRRMEAAPFRVPLPADVAYIFVEQVELIVSAPIPKYCNFRTLLASVVNFMFSARGLTGVSRRQGGWGTNSDVVLDYIDPNVLPSPSAWFFFGHIAPLRHFQVQQDSAAVAFPVPPS
eukprot:jgi/Tetstr1/431103/TSEL_020819.t1